jgi:hypothetical protein
MRARNAADSDVSAEECKTETKKFVAPTERQAKTDACMYEGNSISKLQIQVAT